MNVEFCTNEFTEFEKFVGEPSHKDASRILNHGSSASSPSISVDSHSSGVHTKAHTKANVNCSSGTDASSSCHIYARMEYGAHTKTTTNMHSVFKIVYLFARSVLPFPTERPSEHKTLKIALRINGPPVDAHAATPLMQRTGDTPLVWGAACAARLSSFRYVAYLVKIIMTVYDSN